MMVAHLWGKSLNFKINWQNAQYHINAWLHDMDTDAKKNFIIYV